ncbi:MAG: quinol:electron acceptor oxidoreductase subunit ActD [Nitrospira sp.]|nr:DUF3341 domain-containing protein [Nitrospira sp.]
MVENHTRVGLLALFPPEADMDTSRRRLEEAGIRQEQITLLSPIPLAAPNTEAHPPFWPYGITIAAGLVGIGIGLFFSAGTAALYPLVTGGKPIVAAPVVGIISYETMMLMAVVVTFVTMILRIRRARDLTVEREARIDDGRLALSVRDIHHDQEATVRKIMEQAGALDIRSVSADLPLLEGQPSAHVVGMLALCCLAMAGCSQDMQEQQSYQSQEAPRLHSPSGSIPRDSRTVISRETLAADRMSDRAKELFRINCLPCHGESGEGTGPVAPYLKQLPANLRAPRVRALSSTEIYDIITQGKDMMPSFLGELSADERMVLASFVESMKPYSLPSQR